MGVSPKALRRFHLCADVLLVSTGWLGAYWIRFGLNDVVGRPINPFENYLSALPWIVGPWILSCALFGVYRVNRMASWLSHARDLLRGVVLGLLVISTISFFSKEYDFGRLVVLLSTGLNLFLQGLSRAIFLRIERFHHRTGRTDVPALIVGSGVPGVRLLQKLEDHPETGYRVVGFVDGNRAQGDGSVADRPVLGTLKELRRVVEEHGIEEVFIALPGIDHHRLLSFVIECEDLPVTFRMLTDLFDVLTNDTRIDMIGDLPLVRLGGGNRDRFYVPMKRAFDIVAASLLLAVTSPIFAWYALRIRLDSPGPVIFSQQRCGQHGRAFTLHKFRTMRIETPKYALAPRNHEDPRVTRVGHQLRRTSIDELPQLWNVLRGEMSLVGPRPEMPFIVETYEEWQKRRLRVKPGITGLWQILGRKDLPLHDNLQYDFYYIQNRSLLLDIWILLKTISVVQTSKGAF